MKTLASLFVAAGLLVAQSPPTVEVVRVVAKPLQRTVVLPGEFMPYESVAIFPKVTGFVETVKIDRGSVVKKNDLLARLVAPEMKAQIAELEAKAQTADAQRAEAEAKLVGDQSTYEKLKAASQTPGVVAGNDLVLSEKNVEADRARLHSYESSAKAARAAVQAMQEIEKYLDVTAPFDGVITERKIHPGALVGPAGGPNATAMFQLEQLSRLRLVVAVPEMDLGGIVRRARVSFTVPAYPGESFNGVVARLAHAVDTKTRTMPVEMDVANASGRLSPGMFPQVSWPVHRPKPSLFVPPTAIVVTTERTFVIRVNQSAAEWVNVERGATAGGLVEVFGPLKEGDQVVKRGSDELREGTKVAVKVAQAIVPAAPLATSVS